MQSKITIIFAAIVSVLILLTGCLQATNLFLPQNYGIIEGRAVLPVEVEKSREDNAAPLGEASVYVLEMKTEELVASGKTLKDGTYRVTVPSGGPYLVKVEKDFVKLYAPVASVKEKERKNIGNTNLESTALAVLYVTKIRNNGTISEEELASFLEDQDFATLVEEIKKALQRGSDPLKDDQIINVANDIVLPQVENPLPAIQPQYHKESLTFEAVTPSKAYKLSPFVNIDIRISNPQDDPRLRNKHVVVVLEIQGPQELSENSFPPPQSGFYFKYLGIQEGKWIGYCGFESGIQGIRVGKFFGANVGLQFGENLPTGSYTLNFYLVEVDGLESEDELLSTFRKRTLETVTKKIEVEIIDGLDFEVYVEDFGGIEGANSASIIAQIAGSEEEIRFGLLFSVRPRAGGNLADNDVGIIPFFSGEGGYGDVAQAISEIFASDNASEALAKYRDDLHYLGKDTTGAWIGYYGCGEGLTGMALKGISMHGFVMTFSKYVSPGLYDISVYLVRVDDLSSFDDFQNLPQERVLAVVEATINLKDATPFENPYQPYFGPQNEDANFCINDNRLYIGYHLHNPLVLLESYFAIRLKGNVTISLDELQNGFSLGFDNPHANMELIYPEYAEGSNPQIESDNLLLVWKLNLGSMIGQSGDIVLPLQSGSNPSSVEVYLIDGSSISTDNWESFDFDGNCVGQISLPVKEGCLQP